MRCARCRQLLSWARGGLHRRWRWRRLPVDRHREWLPAGEKERREVRGANTCTPCFPRLICVFQTFCNMTTFRSRTHWAGLFHVGFKRPPLPWGRGGLVCVTTRVRNRVGSFGCVRISKSGPGVSFRHITDVKTCKLGSSLVMGSVETKTSVDFCFLFQTSS